MVEEFGFFENPTNYLRIMHGLSLIALPVHFLGGYCILFKTPRQMIAVRTSMFISFFWSACLDVSLGIFFTPYLMPPSLSGIALGISTYFGISTTTHTYFFMIFISFPSISIVGFFENRYNALVVDNPNNKTRNFFRKVYMLANYTFGCIFPLPACLNVPDQNEAKQFVHGKFPVIAEKFFSDQPYLIVLATDATLFNIGAVSIVVSVCAQTTILAGSTTYFLFSHHAKSHATYVLQKKMFIAICIQFLTPYLIILPPVLYFLYSLNWNYYNQDLNCFMVMLISIHGILTTVATIVIHKPYRTFTIQFIFGAKKKLAPSSRIRSINCEHT